MFTKPRQDLPDVVHVAALPETAAAGADLVARCPHCGYPGRISPVALLPLGGCEHLEGGFRKDGRTSITFIR